MRQHNLLLSERKKCALHQSEVGRLLGVSGDAIGNYELGERTPALIIALGFEILYGKAVASFFPETVLDVAERIVDGANALSARLEGRSDRQSLSKQEYLASLADRLITVLDA